MARRSSRRDFLKQSALAGVGFWAAGGVSFADKKSANETIRIACIGVGGKGSSDTDHAGEVGEVVALCDIDDNYIAGKARKFPKAKTYNDFRKLFDDMGKDFDAVTVSTPDNTHAAAAMMAIKSGKHVYCQKPLTHDVYEARVLRESAEKFKVATQMGNQGTANPTFRHGVETMWAGVLGPVKEVHVWTNRPIWPQAPQVMSRPTPSEPPPNVHWDLWLGPAPERPYAKGEKDGPFKGYHPFNWRGWWDFGTGALGDMACHTMNMPFMGLHLGHPTSVIGECGDLNSETYPSWATVTYQFPARGELPALKLVWYEGHKGKEKVLPPMELFHGEKPSSSGSLIVGEKYTMYSPADYGEAWHLLGQKDTAKPADAKKVLPRFESHDDDLNQKKEWAAAIKGGPAPHSNFSYAGMLAEAVLLGNIAIRMQGKMLEWDAKNLKFPNAADADQYVRREYRKGWSL